MKGVHVKMGYGLLRGNLLVLQVFFGWSFVTSALASEPIVAEAIKKTGLHVKGPARDSGTLTLPQPVRGNQWGLTNHACKKAGYDLTPYAGQEVKSIHYALRETYSGERLSLIILTKDHLCICVYVVAREMIPGIIAVNDPRIK